MPTSRKSASDESENERSKLAEKLRQAREYLGLSQEEVSKAVGIPRAAISLIESGQRRVDALELKKLASVYERPVSYFTGDDYGVPYLPDEVEHLARAVADLSQTDREELARFAEFLQLRANKESRAK